MKISVGSVRRVLTVKFGAVADMGDGQSDRLAKGVGRQRWWTRRFPDCSGARPVRGGRVYCKTYEREGRTQSCEVLQCDFRILSTQCEPTGAYDRTSPCPTYHMAPLRAFMHWQSARG